jgi:hypothetical protein
VFEIVKTRHGYASAPTTLVSFTGANGGRPYGGLIVDAAGDLFSTASGGGADGDGTVFEIAKTEHGYASAPTTLISFTGADGEGPSGSLIADAAGDLFGTTYEGGADGDGTEFEITHSGFATPATTPAADIHTSLPALAFAQAMTSFGAGRSESPHSTLLASRYDTSNYGDTALIGNSAGRAGLRQSPTQAEG